MLHKFSLNQWNNFRKLLVLGLCLIGIAENCFGFVNELNILLKAERNRFFEKNNFLNYSPALKKDLEKANDIKLDQDFLISTILRLDPKHRKFLKPSDPCSVYSYLVSGQAQNALGEVKSLAINYQKDGVLTSSIISLNDFHEMVVKPRCPKVIPFSEVEKNQYFQTQLKKIKEMIPTEPTTCEKDFQEILNSSHAINLCHVYEQTKKARSNFSVFRFKTSYLNRIKKLLDKQDQFFLNNLCLSQKDSQVFCKDIFEANYWQKISQGKHSPHITPIYCGANSKNTKNCLNKLSDNPKSCQYPQFLSSSLVPAMNCDHLSLAFNHSHLKTKYPECPLQIENMGLVAASRLITHIKKGEHEVKPEYCVSYPLSQFVDFNFEFGNALAWDYQLCYFDKIEQADKCLPSIIGSLDKYEYSQDLVISKILQKNGIISDNQSCTAVDEDAYNPNLLKFKSGCYILGQLGRCSLTKCKFKVLYNEKEIDIIKTNPAQNFDYISSTRDYRNFSQVKLITEQLKKNSSEIRNLSVLKNFFKNHPKDIIHGVGCLQSILPHHFQMNSLNQCEPIPFIIDGHVDKDGTSYLVTRTSLDHLHAPRLIPWQRVYSGVKTLHDLHPQKAWSMNGLY